MNAPKVFDRENIHLLPWPKNELGSYAKQFLVPFIQKGPNQYISNIQTNLSVVLIDDLVLPITVNDAEYDNSFTCSPYTHYISCALEYLDHIQTIGLKNTLKPLINSLSPILIKGQVNKVVTVNNWLMTTNLYPSISEKQISTLTEFLKNRFSDHAILFRSINNFNNDSIYQSLISNDFDLIANRQVFFVDAKQQDSFKSRMFKSDLKVLEKTEYQLNESHEITIDDVPRILELYNALYLEKHSKLSPHLTLKFIELVLTNNLLSFKAFRKNGVIDAVVGYFSIENQITSPLFGYDIQKPQELGLYRLISTILALEAKKTGALLNQSAGASSFKKLRRASGCIEYLAVNTTHLPYTRIFPWKMLKMIDNHLGIALMQREDI